MLGCVNRIVDAVARQGGVVRTSALRDAHDAALMLLGYRVIRVTSVQVTQRWHEVQDLIMRAVAQGLHRAV